MTSILCLVIQKPGTNGCIFLFPAGAVLKCTFAACHGPVLPALVPLTLRCTSQNLLTFIFTLTIQISSTANVSDCTSTSSWCILKFAQQLWSCADRLFQKVLLHHARHPAKRIGQQCYLVPKFSKRDLLQQAKGALLSNISKFESQALLA